MTEAAILASMFVMIAIGVPIAVAILASALLGAFVVNDSLAFLNAMLSLFNGATSFPLIAIPLFVLAGALMNTSGISTRLIAWALLLPMIILGGIFGGGVTATEGAGLAVLAALLIGVFVYRELDLSKLYHAFVDGVLLIVTYVPAVPLWLVGVFYGP